MKCPTFRCPENLALNSRKKYCVKCRQSMYYWDKKSPNEIIEARYRREKSLFRISHIEERKDDQQLAAYRKEKREKQHRGNGRRNSNGRR